MGIPRFVSWLNVVNFPNVLQKNQPTNISSFSFDINGLIHQCAQIVYAYNEGADPVRREYVEKTSELTLQIEFFQVFASKLVKILTAVRPDKILVIAVDGVAPQAKINQQRKRRFKSSLESGSNSKFDSNCITPGTDFMKKVDKFIEEWISTNKMYRASDYPLLPDTVIYSSHLEPGEGEHKIMNLIRQGHIKGTGAHVIYGMDADLIMLSLLAPINNVYLIREDINDVVNIESLKFNLQQTLNPQTGVFDFVFMSFFIGNDFLPHLLSHADLPYAFEIMFQVYRKLGIHLIVGGKPDWQAIRTFLLELSEYEPQMLTREATKKINNPLPLYEKALTETQVIREKTAFSIGNTVERVYSLDMDVFSDLWYHKVFDPKVIVPELLSITPKFFDKNEISDMAYKYLVGLYWIYTYYTTGMNGINLDYVYDYHYPPLLEDIASLAQSVSKVTGYEKIEDQMPINPIYQLLAVLPIKSKNLLPSQVQHLLDSNSPISDLYPKTALVDYEGLDEKEKWRGTVLIPFADISRIIKAVKNNTKFDTKDLNKLKPTNTLFIQRTEEQTRITNVYQTIALEREHRRSQRHHHSPNTGRGRGGRGRSRNSEFETGRGRGRSRNSESSGGRGRSRNGEFETGRGRGRSRNVQFETRRPRRMGVNYESKTSDI